MSSKPTCCLSLFGHRKSVLAILELPYLHYVPPLISPATILVVNNPSPKGAREWSVKYVQMDEYKWAMHWVQPGHDWIIGGLMFIGFF